MGKKLLFSALAALLAYGFIEALSWSVIRLLDGPAKTLAAIRESRARVLADAQESGAAPRTAARWNRAVLHPYLGYAGDPAEPDFNDFGFPAVEGFLSSDPDAVIVALTGGSVAVSVWENERQRIADALSALPEVRDRPIHVISFALFGYKQPQQVSAVSYYLALGGRLDIVINLDGFNEIGNGMFVDAFREGRTHPVFPNPRAWGQLSGAPSPAATSLAGRIAMLRETRSAVARTFERVGWSITGNLAWMLVDRSLGARIVSGNDEIARSALEDRERLGGPTVPPDVVYEYVADLWMRSSLQLEHLARANRFTYYHFLQPNMFVPGSKVLTRNEKWFAGVGQKEHRRHVVAGYPLLRARGEELTAAGVRFFDLSGVFSDETGEIWIDACCHTNRRGDQLIAEAIARAIVEDARDPDK